MKKRVITFMACAVIAIASITGCSGGKGGKAYATVKDYVSDPAVKETLDSALEQYGDTMDIKIEAEDDNLIYVFSFPEGTDITGLAESLEAGMAAQETTFVAIADGVKALVNKSPVKVTLKYNAFDGTEIYSKVFESSK